MGDQLAKQFTETNEKFYRLSGKIAGLETQVEYYGVDKAENAPKISAAKQEQAEVKEKLQQIETRAQQAGGEELEAYLYEKKSWDAY